MAHPIHVPRINNNDDEVKLVELKVAAGDKVEAGKLVAVVETDKAVLDVEASAPGFVIGIAGEAGQMVTVGSVLLWLGTSAEEKPPQDEQSPAAAAGGGTAQPTAKARALLRQHGLRAEDVRASGERLSAEDVERHVAALAGRGAARSAEKPAARPETAGVAKPLRSDQRGMLATVVWHRDVAVPGYIEIQFDPRPWDDFATRYQQRHGLLLNPLLPLLAGRVVGLAVDKPQLNATIVDEQRFEFSSVNLGFTVQAGEVLYLAVVREANRLAELDFVRQLIDLQRRAAAHALGPAETSGTTIGFSSMSRWKVSRHVPVLAPHTAMMVAHTVDAQGTAVLGATYDHRVLHGADVAAALRRIAQAPAAD